jgi:hypothetical protein
MDAYMLWLASCGLSRLHQFALLWFVWSVSNHPSITGAYVLLLERWCDAGGPAYVLYLEQ